MGDPAIEKANDPLAIEGLEDVFEVAPVTEIKATDAAPVTDAKAPVTSASEPVPDLGSIPVEEAAQLMGTSANALKKRLRKGTLRGNKVEAKHGEKWFVDSNELKAFLAPVTDIEATGAAPLTDAKAPVTVWRQIKLPVATV